MALEKVLKLAEKWEGKAVLYDVQGQPLSAKEAYINAAAIRALVEVAKWSSEYWNETDAAAKRFAWGKLMAAHCELQDLNAGLEA